MSQTDTQRVEVEEEETLSTLAWNNTVTVNDCMCVSICKYKDGESTVRVSDL